MIGILHWDECPDCTPGDRPRWWHTSSKSWWAGWRVRPLNELSSLRTRLRQHAGCKCNQSNQADELVLKLLRSLRVLPKTELRKESCKHFIGQSRSIPEWLPTALIEVSSTKTRQHVQGHGNPDNRRGRDLLLRGCHILRLSRLIMATKFCD